MTTETVSPCNVKSSELLSADYCGYPDWMREALNELAGSAAWSSDNACLISRALELAGIDKRNDLRAIMAYGYDAVSDDPAAALYLARAFNRVEASGTEREIELAVPLGDEDGFLDELGLHRLLTLVDAFNKVLNGVAVHLELSGVDGLQLHLTFWQQSTAE